jgi:uncharacterized protein YndB with AHSA1/START domain
MANEGKRELTLNRVFNAPQELVWKAWTDPKLMSKWWGPRGVTTPTCDVDARVGGKMYIVMLAGKELGPFAGKEWPMKATIEEIIPPGRMVFISEALDDERGVMLEVKTTLTLEKQAKKTKMTLHMVVTKITKAGEFAVAGMEQGWNQSLDKLGEFLGGM